ncbi:unnamed protein product [Tetraodon nigroviridis]|uniref:(spotted green pufferfish) hypothetical protein n=1 Tax=Tetraodon nigroviridis TaxID=99883 RepID=Q4ST01_TETNG|nr:unnamed protein product [Tetraodon nigroviridis]
MGIDRRRRASLALTLNFVALFLAVSALTTSYWCEGTRKVVKPFCTGPVTTKQSFCIRFNSSNLNDTRLVQYIWETGEDKYVMRKFHTGIWFSCEQNVNMTGVLWLCIVAECLYILLLATGGILMSIEVCHFGNVIDGLKLNAFAAIFTVLSGLLGMVAHMMFTTAFQLTVSLGPEDWKPQTWDYSWSYIHHHQPLHQNHPGVQTQTQKHREEPEDQAEAAGAGLSRAGVGHVHQFCAQHCRGTVGPVVQRSQTLQLFPLPGPQRLARRSGRGVLLEEEACSITGTSSPSVWCNKIVTANNNTWLQAPPQTM